MSAVARLVVALVGVSAVLGLGVGPAAAHGGAAEISVVDTAEVEPTVFEITVEIGYVLDQHPAIPATFLVSGVGPDGAIVDAQNLASTDDEGVYRATVEFPVVGDWTLTFQSSLPPGELEYPLAVGGEAVVVGPAGAPTTVGPDTSSSGGGPSSVITGEELVESGGSGPPALLLGGLAASALVAVVVAVVVVRTGRRSPSS